ncbi:MAG: alpha/beta fold hydrolase [Proteobacteria bacterium]|nr:alpha/beta fold hydrolase [Pseudomonadota bacterium]
MRKNVLLIPGWGQKPEVLNPAVRDDFHGVGLDYAVYPSKERLFSSFSKVESYEFVIGWSLGGQIALELIGRGLIKTHFLVLIAAPYQYVSDEPTHQGVTTQSFKDFCAEYENDPSGMLSRFRYFIAQGDSNAKQVVKGLRTHTDAAALKNLGYWLQQLNTFSASKMDLNDFPRTLIVHGKEDAVTHVEQAHLLHAAIKQSAIYIVESCGHAPHLHDPSQILNQIENGLANAGL